MKLLKMKCDDGQLDYMVKFDTVDEDKISETFTDDDYEWERVA